MDIYNPDTTITASDLESLVLEHLGKLPIRGVEGRTLDPDDAWPAVLHAAVEQTSIHDITEQTTDTPCSDRVLEWLATVDPDEFEDAVNDALARQAQQMLLKEVRFPLAICVSYQKGKRGKTGLLVRAYAACEQDARTPKQVEETYRQRSAIETSFRTFREALATTTTRDPGIRLVYVGVAFLLRNLWILVGWAVLAQPRRGGRALPRWFPFKRFRKWIGHALDERLGWIWEVPSNGVGVPLSHRNVVAG